jgi:hypothetical protein
MARAQRSSTIGSFPEKITVTRVTPTFEPLRSLRDLDLAKLARARRAKVELGFLSSGECRQVVRAIVVNGRATGLELEGCRPANGRGKRASPEVVRLLRTAKRIVDRKKARRPWRPVPVTTLVQRPAARIIETITCFKVCILSFWCYYCCTTSTGGWMCTWGPVIMTGPVIIFIP